MRYLNRRTGPTTADPVPLARDKDLAVIGALRSGDEQAFRSLVAEHGPWMLRLARRRTSSEAVAEEVVQEAWVAILQSLDRFEGRSSLRTWMFSIVSHIGTGRFHAEMRTIPFSAFETESRGPSVPPERFQPPASAQPGGWLRPPAPWDESPEQFLASTETQRAIAAAINRLPPAQREVIALRDVEGWTSAEVCNALNLSETNQRVLLHRARSRVRLELESYLGSKDRE